MFNRVLSENLAAVFRFSFTATDRIHRVRKRLKIETGADDGPTITSGE